MGTCPILVVHSVHVSWCLSDGCVNGGQHHPMGLCGSEEHCIFSSFVNKFHENDTTSKEELP